MIPIRKQIINNKQKGMCQNWHLPFFAQSPDFRKPGYNLQTGAENQFIIDFRLFPNPYRYADPDTFFPLLPAPL